ncbi:hypothetical protein FQN55_006612 [Onygenales sp. PD_40]|nr:hypothetical protein FQN55_006612 [Onygenales sp. PD_40]KAK2789473.1 hypothetical protein FQN53_001920 [Emmonsiellopsis sp. PD_33]KAK2791255.1 hypothetical protein FQN52_004931 [Onygenales sp. PD_12]
MHLPTTHLLLPTLLTLLTLTLAKSEPEDCATAAYANFADVECYYDFDKGGDFLNYVIKIPPTGQDSKGWCKGIMDNIKGECGDYADNISYKHCNDQYESKRLEFPNNEVYHGIDYNFHWEWKWIEGDDMKTCVKRAVEKASCAAAVRWPDGGCYKRN